MPQNPRSRSGVAFEWYLETPGADEGILVIRVPPQAERVRPFLVTRVMDADGGELNAFACPKRNQDRIEWMRADRVQQHLNLASTLADRLAELTIVRRPEPTMDLPARATALRLAVGAGEDPCIAIQVQPPASVDLLPRMFGPTGLMTALREWTGMRKLGFDLTTANEAESENGNIVVRGHIGPDGSIGWLMRIDADGVLHLALPHRWQFLGWALLPQQSAEGTNPRINSLVLVEVVFDFFRFLRQHVDATGQWSGRVTAWAMKRSAAELHEGYRRRENWGYGSRPRMVTGDEYTQVFACPGPAERRRRPE